jgi:quinoprotein glucose dehydrogenase
MSFKYPDDVAKITPEHEAACRAELETLGGGRNLGPNTPYSSEGALVMPYILGGATWTGGAFDPTLGYYIINTTDSGEIGQIVPQTEDPRAPKESPRLFGRPGRTGGGNIRAGGSLSLQGWPCWQPPWGRLTAINVNTGDIAWQIPFGTMAGVPAGIKTGAPNLGGGPLTTAGGLIFIGATVDHMFRAFDTKTGEELWSVKTDGIVHADPITFMGKDGKQYVAFTADAELLTYRLP